MDVEKLIEPSDAEQAEWTDTTRDYVHSLTAALAQLQAERDEAREALRPFVLFFDAAIDAGSDGRDFDGSDIQDTAAHLGLLVETTFDPEKHTDETGVGANEGDQWFVLSDAASNAVRAASRALGGGE